MQIKLNIEKKHFWVLTVFGILILGLFSAVIAIAGSGGGNNAADFGHDLVCATGKLDAAGTLSWYKSSDGEPGTTYDVFEKIAERTVGCKSGWVMTSCSNEGSGYSNDIIMGSNRCTQSVENILYIRCCTV